VIDKLNGTYYGTLGDDFWQLSLDTPIGYGRAGNDTLYGSDSSEPCTATEEMIPCSGIEGRMREQIRCDRFFLVR
jgi:hypothetical protein